MRTTFGQRISYCLWAGSGSTAVFGAGGGDVAADEAVLKGMVSRIYHHDIRWVAEHALRVMKIALLIAADLNLDSGTTKALCEAALLHDIGKGANKRFIELTNKKGQFRLQERLEFLRHPFLSLVILKGARITLSRLTVLLIEYHNHRKYFIRETREERHLWPIFVVLELPDSIDAFIEGKVAIIFGYNQHRQFIEARRQGKLNYEVVGVPQIEGRPAVNIARYPIHAVSRKTADVNEAWDFLQFIARRDACEDEACLAAVLIEHTNSSLGGTSPYPQQP